MSGRDTIFASIRSALGVNGHEAPRRKEVADRLSGHPAGIVPKRGNLPPKERLALFVKMMEAAAGTVTPVAEIAEIAHEAGALAWVDAVHYAPHGPIDVAAVGADVLLCSPYKFYGPHLGVAFGRRELLESWRPYKVRPSSDTPVAHRFETGTLAHEIARPSPMTDDPTYNGCAHHRYGPDAVTSRDLLRCPAAQTRIASPQAETVMPATRDAPVGCASTSTRKLYGWKRP